MKRLFGFSTGALAHGDFRRALCLLESHQSDAVELSALREGELRQLMDAAPGLALEQFAHVSIHAPSRLTGMSEKRAAELLRPCIERGWHVILHPDAIVDHGYWRDFGALVCIENMDIRKPQGRTAKELAPHFEQLRDASLCLDLGHAQQVDPTMGVARQILAHHGERLRQIHLSELNARSQHEPLSMATVWAVREIVRGIPCVPVILESVVGEEGIGRELDMARSCFVHEQEVATAAG